MVKYVEIATVPYKVIEQMINHLLTEQGITKFQKDYEKVFGKLKSENE